MQISNCFGNWFVPGRLRINYARVPVSIPKNDVPPKNLVYPNELIFKIEPSLVVETINESTDVQKPPTPQQGPQQQQQQLPPLQQQQQQQPSGGIVTGGIGGGDGTPAATPTSAVNVQQSQQAVPSATPTPTTANPHSAAGPPSNNQPSPHPSPLYPGIPQQAGQPNGSTQGKTRISIWFRFLAKQECVSDFGFPLVSLALVVASCIVRLNASSHDFILIGRHEHSRIIS